MLVAFFTGRLRRRFFLDVDMLGGEDAASRVSAAYGCLGGAIGWLLSVLSLLILTPDHYLAELIALVGLAGGVWGFGRLRRRKDPRPVMIVMVFALLASAAALSLRNAGTIAPIMGTLPVAATAIALYMRGRMRGVGLLIGLAVLVLGFFTSSGVIGFPSNYAPEALRVMTYSTLLLSMTALGGIAWMATLSRDYGVKQVREAHAAIVESAKRSRVALEAAKVGLWDVPNADSPQRQFHVSESFASITGYSAEEFDGIFQDISRFVHPDDIAPLREAFGVGRRRMSRIRVDFRLMTRARGYRWFSARAAYLANPDGTIRISGSLQDITFIKAAEEALRAGRDRAREANKAKSDFIAMMSHEVRTPLNAILGSVEVLKRTAHSPDTAEMIQLIDDAGHGLLAMVNDLLDVSKIEAGKLDISPEELDLAALVRRTVDFWRPQAGAKGLTLAVDTSAAVSPRLMVDPIRIRQILGNLLSNAVKFTDFGGVETRLSTRALASGRIEVTLSVIDTGPGVSPSMSETIFAPFEQASSDASRGGAGLGLFICRRLARMMAGDVTVEPAQPRGSHFRLTIEVDPAPQANDAGETPHQDGSWRGRHVLCVDDNEKNRRIAALLLDQFGVETIGCESGAEAVRLCREQVFDCILMDIVMPVMDGFETLRRLREDLSGPNHQTPVIAVTAKLAAEDMTRYAHAGFDGVTGKPINVRDLAQQLEPFLSRPASLPAA